MRVTSGRDARATSGAGGRVPAVIDWATVSSLATAGGTLVLAVATFGSVRSANRAARAAEGSLLAGLRPLIVPSHLQDPPEKITSSTTGWSSWPVVAASRR